MSARLALVLVKVLTSWAGVFVLVVLVLVVFVRVVFARDDAVAFVAVAFVPRAVLFNVVSVSPAPRKSVWSDNTVVAEHVDVERTVCFTDSIEARESAGKDVTAIAGYIMSLYVSDA